MIRAELRSLGARICPKNVKMMVATISNALPFGRLWYGGPNPISYAKFYGRSHDAVIRVYDEADSLIEMHEQAGEFKEW